MTLTLWMFCTHTREKPWVSALGSSSPSAILTSTPMVVKCSPAVLWVTCWQWLEVSSFFQNNSLPLQNTVTLIHLGNLCFSKSHLTSVFPATTATYQSSVRIKQHPVDSTCFLLFFFFSSPDFMDVMKCEHERAVHLFVDSLMNREHMSFAFQCTDPSRFRKGICLSCRKNRCNNMGYDARKMRKRRNSKMYLKTRADTPFGGELQYRRGLDKPYLISLI